MEAPPVTTMPVSGGTINMMEYLLQAVKDLFLFSRKLIFKKIFEKDGCIQTSDDIEREALMALEDLLNEQTSTNVVSLILSTCLPLLGTST
ncbi:mediator of RNA polymerase II transcription subunit 18 isoform X2 [Ranitomeya imitator]|uniref:mediator of RNA polymerase II transcription subunit 18 isoform X2 n=1 Tax=Ranitomeya imitator TaxID=111125 RepID=UPI0037E9747B